jgi:DNA-binding MarR family transcriptional regulator
VFVAGEAGVGASLIHFCAMASPPEVTARNARRQDSDAAQAMTHDNDSKNSLRAWIFMLKCAKRLEQEMSDRFREQFQSSLSRFDVMAHLDMAGASGLNTSQLAGRLLASKGNITRLLDRMAQDGLIDRRGDENDRRVSRVQLSEKGRELFSRMAPAHERWSHEILGGTGKAERDSLVALLRRLHDQLEQQR